MAYENNSFSPTDGFDQVQAKLATFAVAQGWTSHYNTSPYLHLSKGDVFVNLFFNTAPTVDDRGNTGSATAPDYTIYGHLSTAFTSNGTNTIQFLNQTGSLVNGSNLGDSAFVKANDFVGPYSQYWLFSGAGGDPDYIHMIVQKANGRFCYFGFGKLDKKGASYTGGAFLCATFWHWWFQQGASPGVVSSGQGSDTQPNSSLWAGAAGAGHAFLGDANGNYNIWLGDLDLTFPMIAHDFQTPGNSYEGVTPMMARSPNANLQGLENINVDPRWLHPIFFLGPNPVNGVTPFFELHVPKSASAAGNRSFYMGAVPGYRWCSMINRLEAETVALGSDDWLVFPFKRALPWYPEPFSTKTITSGPYGHTFKKNP